MAAAQEEDAGTGNPNDLGIDLESITKATPRRVRDHEKNLRRVIEEAGLQPSPDGMRIASHVCGAEGVAGIPYLDEGIVEVDLPNGDTKLVPVIDLQVKKLVQLAEKASQRNGGDVPMVLGPTAQKIARAALDLRVREGLFVPPPEISREERAAQNRAAYAARRGG